MRVRHLFPIVCLVLFLLYGLAVRPLALGKPQLPLEIIFILASILSVAQLFKLGYGWNEIQSAMVQRLSKALPAVFILFCIGIVIGSWIVAGTIPMLVYYGIRIINPQFIYLVAFLVPVVFSTLTGTSWGSAGTIGVVIMGIAGAIQADLAITAGAVVGGAYMGDKISPLSDTTNVAALSADVDLYSHIRSMMNTTLPSAVLATLAYALLGLIFPPVTSSAELGLIEPTLEALQSLFNFNLYLLLPVLVVLYGAITKKPTVPVLIMSSVSATVLALIFQSFSLQSVVTSLYKGFNVNMSTWTENTPTNVVGILNRGGLYELNDAIIITLMVFIFIGSLELTNAMPTVVNSLFRFAKTRATTILSALAATAITNAMTSNQFATSFIIGDAFKSKFDRLKIPRKVLSRSLEDTGTMLENVLPWTTTGVYMAATLGVAVGDYWNWQFLSLFNFVIAPALAILGVGCFYHEETDEQENRSRSTDKR